MINYNNYAIDLVGCCVVEDDGLTEEEYEVEKILKRRRSEDGRAWLYVKWLGWDNKFNTWEAEDRMDEVEQYEHFLSNFDQKRFIVSSTSSCNSTYQCTESTPSKPWNIYTVNSKKTILFEIFDIAWNVA